MVQGGTLEHSGHGGVPLISLFFKAVTAEMSRTPFFLLI